MPRPSFDQTLMELAEVWAKRATCPRASVGAILVNEDHQILASGYNGAVRGHAHCLDIGCLMEGDHCVRAVHAEANALMQAARLGVKVEGATLYVTHAPCIACAKLLAQAGVYYVKFKHQYRPDNAANARWWEFFKGTIWLHGGLNA